MTNKTPQEQSALEKLGEAALAVPKMHGNEHVEFNAAVEAYRATQTPPRECRPDKNAAYGSYHWLIGDHTGKAVPFCWTASPNRCWTTYNGAISPAEAAEKGYTYHSPCIFPGTVVEATDEAIREFMLPFGRETWPQDCIALRAALRHFAPKLREISDNQISKIADDDRWPSIAEANFGEAVKYVRAIISYVAGGEK